MANTFGHLFRIHTFGESHGPGLGVVIDGCPAGVQFDETVLRHDLARRRPGVSNLAGNSVVSPRNESDEPEILSGIYEGRTLGTPITILVRNQDARSQDYAKQKARAGHADDTWSTKFGHTDPRGGGRSSGRETVSRVMGGAVAKMFLKQISSPIKAIAYALQIGNFELTNQERNKAVNLKIDDYCARFPSARHQEIQAFLKDLQEKGESVGGVAELRIQGVPGGVGQPVFHKLKSDLAMAMMTVGATCGIEIGEGSNSLSELGSSFHLNESHYGGIRGGISTGEDILMRVHFKPTSSIMDVAKRGRHDPCIIPRAITVLEAMAWLVLADHVLWQRLDRA